MDQKAKNGNVWRIIALTGGKKENRLSQIFIRNHIVGCGWGVETEAPSLTFDEYQQLATEKYGNGKFTSCVALATKVQTGDYIWMRDNGRYYIGKVSNDSHWRYNHDDFANEHDLHNVITHIDWQLASKSADESDVPGCVTTSFRGQAFRQIPEYSHQGIYKITDLLYSQIANLPLEKPFKSDELTSAEFFNYLGTAELEDLLYFYLHAKYHYLAVPSTGKLSTELYEFVLINPDPVKNHVTPKAYIQAKLGNVNLVKEDYRHLDGNVYLVTTRGQVTGNADNVHVIALSDLFDFAKDNLGWLPRSITQWFTIFQD